MLRSLRFAISAIAFQRWRLTTAIILLSVFACASALFRPGRLRRRPCHASGILLGILSARPPGKVSELRRQTLVRYHAEPRARHQGWPLRPDLAAAAFLRRVTLAPAITRNSTFGSITATVPSTNIKPRSRHCSRTESSRWPI